MLKITSISVSSDGTVWCTDFILEFCDLINRVQAPKEKAFLANKCEKTC